MPPLPMHPPMYKHRLHALLGTLGHCLLLPTHLFHTHVAIRALGDRLVVSFAGDESLKAHKGGRAPSIPTPHKKVTVRNGVKGVNLGWGGSDTVSSPVGELGQGRCPLSIQLHPFLHPLPQALIEALRMVDEVVVGSDVDGEGSLRGLDFLSHFMRIRCGYEVAEGMHV